jgi:prepilin-type N-terminal cleavage/methylation domain-containing protein
MKLRKNENHGFTLTELMIVVAVVGLLATMAMPSMVKARRVTQSNVMFSDMRTAAGAFEVYALEMGDYPPNSGPGVVPMGMADYLGDFNWTSRNSVNGRWNWDVDRHGFRAGVSVSQVDVPEDVMQQLDDRVDDGDLSSGVFRSRPGGYSFVLE